MVGEAQGIAAKMAVQQTKINYYFVVNEGL
jgi:hypothetical protein